MDKKISKIKIIKSIFGFSLPTWINAAISILAVPLVTRLFEPDVLGKFNLFTTYCTILYCIALLGINQGLMRFYNEPPGRNTTGGIIKLCQIIVVISITLIGIVVFIFGNDFSIAIAGEYSSYIVICLVICIAASSMLNLINSAYRMQKSILSYGVLTILMNFCAKITYAGAALVEDKFLGAVTLFTGSYLILAVVYVTRELISYNKQRVYLGKEEVVPILKYSIPLMPILFISQINTALPKIVIAEYLDYSQVGIYTAAFSIVSIISIVQSGINVFWTPFVYDNYSDNQKYLSTGHILITLIMTVFGLLVVLFQDVIYMLIGPSYQASKQFFALLLFSPICYTISETTGIGINISKKTYLNFVVYGVTIAVTFGLCYLLIPMFGLLGAAISVAVAAFVMLVIKTIIGERYFKVITSYVKSFSAPVLFLIIVSLNTLCFNFLWARTTITLVGIALVYLIYRNEMVSLIKMLVGLFKKQPQGE